MKNVNRLPVVAVALLTLGGGLLNVYSVVGRGRPERVNLLREAFPLEVVELSRSATLLAGFTLVVASLNLYRRKRLAFWIVSAAAAFSAIFHLTKGPHYEEALFSAALLGVLYISRRSYTVRSRRPNWRGAIKRVGIAVALALAYGMAGFRFLESRDFGANFNWQESFRYSLDFLTLRGNPGLRPHTHHARWFLDSLSLMASTAYLYSLFVMFRPVLYQLRTHPLEVERADQFVKRFGRSSLDFFKTRPDKSFYFSEEGVGFVAYSVGSSYAVALGDPVGPEEGIGDLMAGFTRYCEDNGWGVAFYQVMPDFLASYQKLGFKRLKIGDDAIVEMAGFSLEDKARKPFRAKVSQLEKAGIKAEYHQPPIGAQLMAQVREVSGEWLQIPGRRERRFALGMFDEEYLSSTPVFTASDGEGRVLAFVNLIPSSRPGEATADLMRRRSKAPNGIMDYVFVKLLLYLKDEGFKYFNMGMSPMSGFHAHEEAAPEERAIHAFFQHLNFLFSFKGLHAYKAKFATAWEPRYLIYRNILDLPRVALALASVSELEDD